MKSKKYTLLFLITFFSVSLYSQEKNSTGKNNEVWIEDQEASKKWKENDAEFRELDKQFDEMMDNFTKFYRDLWNSGFNKSDGGFSKEGLQKFIAGAEQFKNKINNNSEMIRLNNRLNELAKVTSRGPEDRIAQYVPFKNKSIDSDISSAKEYIKQIEANESKKESSLSFDTTNTSSSNTTSNQNAKTNNSTYQSNTSSSNSYYQNALARQQVYEQSIQTAATQLTNLGVSIFNNIEETRINNIRSYNKYLSEYLSKMIPLDKECAQLYANNDYQTFLIKEKELRKLENGAISYLNELMDLNKKGYESYKTLKTEVFSNQIVRLKQILEHNTEEILKNTNNYKNMDFVNYCFNFYLSEFKDFRGDLVDNNGWFNSKSNPTSTSNYSWFIYWREFIDVERRERTRRILELNKTNNLLDTYSELAFYLSNNYGNSEQDEKLVKYFLNSSTELKESLWEILVYARNYKNITRSDMFNDRLYIRDDKHLRFLLGSSEEKIYNYEFIDYSTKKRAKKPLYKLLNDSDFGLKDSKINELVKKWIKNGDKITGKNDGAEKLNRDVFEIKFFESGGSGLKPEKERVYTDKFSKNTTRGVITSITFNNPNYNKTDFYADLKMHYYNQEGTLVGSPATEVIIPKEFEAYRIQTGMAGDTFGNWQTGTYTVEIWTGDYLIKTGYFTIY